MAHGRDYRSVLELIRLNLQGHEKFNNIQYQSFTKTIFEMVSGVLEGEELGQVHEFDLDCMFCDKKARMALELPSGWKSRGAPYLENDIFCQDHNLIIDFLDAQCSGCVGGWGDCGLFRSFAYDHDKDFSEEDAEQLRKGICPRRVNGTMESNVDENGLTLKDVDLSELATSESGTLLAKSIQEYLEKFPPTDPLGNPV